MTNDQVHELFGKLAATMKEITKHGTVEIDPKDGTQGYLMANAQRSCNILRQAITDAYIHSLGLASYNKSTKPEPTKAKEYTVYSAKVILPKGGYSPRIYSCWQGDSVSVPVSATWKPNVRFVFDGDKLISAEEIVEEKANKMTNDQAGK
jgi:hypothetical protein